MHNDKTKTKLLHMLDHSREAISLLEGKSRTDLDHDRLLNLSIVRLLEIVGEAANKIPKDSRVKYTKIPWSEIIGLRNRLIHAYDSADLDIVWEIVSKDLPLLVEELENILSDKQSN